MGEEIIFSTEQRRRRDEIADYFRTIADGLDRDGSITLSAGSDSVSLSVPPEPTFEVEVEVEREDDGGEPEYSLEFELEWRAGRGDEGTDEGTLRIE